jgi:hypothetical protein
VSSLWGQVSFFPNYRDPVGKHADSFALSHSLRRRRDTRMVANKIF